MHHSSRWLLTVLAVAGLTVVGRADDWPQWLGPKRDSIWRETGILSKFPDNGPKVLWRASVQMGYAGPAVVGDRVFVTDYVRADGDTTPDPSRRNELKGKERVLAFSAKTGAPLWKHEYDCPYKVSYPNGPRCTPTVAGGKVYTLGAEGNLLCLDAAKGTLIWSKELKKEYQTQTPQWGFSGHPLVDGNQLICLVGGEGSVVVSFDKDTGREKWKALSAAGPGYCPPSIIEAGGKRQLLIFHPEAVNGIDPETGKPYWSVAIAPDYGMSITMPRQLGDYLFVSGVNDKAVLLKLAKDKPAVEEVWRGTKRKGVFCSNSTPFLEASTIFGVDGDGLLRGVNLADGERLWESSDPTSGRKRMPYATAFLVKNGDRFFLMGETGFLIIAKLSRDGYEELGRTRILQPTYEAFGRPVVWSHPAFAQRCCFARNDKELICVSLAAVKP